MADLISRLKLESGEFDSKIKRAGQELLAYSEHCKKVGLQMGFANEDAKKFASALGSMATTSQTARGKLNELTSTFTDLSVMYKNMTEQEKNSTFGKNLAASLDQLKTRINDTKAQLNDVSIELGNTKNAAGGAGSIVDELTSKFGLNIKQLAGWGAAAGAAKAAMDVLKDAFFSSESNIDEWGRTVEGAKGAYDVFLQTINGGNWSNFFTNLTTAIQGARDLYDALDRLGSVKSNNQAAIAIQQQQVAQLRLMKQQGQNVDEQLKAATERLAQLQMQAVDAGKVAGNKTITETIKNGISGKNTTGVKISEGTLAGVTGNLTNRGQDAFDEYKRQYDSLTQKGLETVTKYDTLTKSYYDAQVFHLEKLSKEDQKQYLIAMAVTDRETEIQKGIGIYAQAVQEGAAAAREQFKGNRYALQGTGGSGSKTTPQEQAQKMVEDALLAYSQTVEKARLEMESGYKSEADVKKATLSAQERLYDAYGKAYATYADPKYKEAKDVAAEEIKKLGGEVKATTEAQKAAEQAVREQEAAAKKLADAQDKLANALESGDLKQIYAAQKGVETARQGVVRAGGTVSDTPAAVEVPVGIKYTTGNMEAFIGQLKEDLSKEEVGTEVFNKITEQLSDATAISEILSTALQNGISEMPFDSTALLQRIMNSGDISDTEIQGYVATLNEQLKAVLDETEWPNVIIKFDADTKNIVNAAKEQETSAKKTTAAWTKTSSAVQQLGQAMQNIEDPSVKAVGTVVQAIASAALGFAQASKGPFSNPWEWVAFGISGLATLVTMITTIHSATGMKDGGIVGRATGGFVPGQSYSGDNIWANEGSLHLDSGELILNRAQQGIIASQLADRGGVGESQPYVLGEQIWFGLKAYTKRRGMGEIITSR